MTPDTILAALRRQPEPVRCGLCFGASGHIPMNPGDGPPRCTSCVYKRGRWAADPDSLDQSALTALWSAHGDVSDLRACRAHVLEWRFIGWTDERDTLVDEVAADAFADSVAHVAAVAWAS